jgi:hypothetical protein
MDKDMEGSDCGLMEVLKLTMNICQDIQSLGRYLNPGPPDYEANNWAVTLVYVPVWTPLHGMVHLCRQGHQLTPVQPWHDKQFA